MSERKKRIVSLVAGGVPGEPAYLLTPGGEKLPIRSARFEQDFGNIGVVTVSMYGRAGAPAEAADNACRPHIVRPENLTITPERPAFSFNLNDRVRVTLTEAGVNLVRESDPLAFGVGSTYRIVGERTIEIHAWKLFAALGSSLKVGAATFIVGNRVEVLTSEDRT